MKKLDYNSEESFYHDLESLLIRRKSIDTRPLSDA